MAARSSARLIRRELRCALKPADMLRRLRHDAHPFALVGGWSGGGSVLGSEPVLTASPPVPLSDVVDAPFPFDHNASALGAFGGGWIGYLGYGLAREIHPLPQEPGGVRRLPLWWFGYYDHVLRLESTSGRWYFEALCAAEREDEIERRYAELTSRLANRPLAATYSCGEFLATPDRQAHIDSVARAIELIKRGDIFQANITLRLETWFSGDPLDFFCRGSDQLKPPFAAFIRLPEGAIASFSPELFLRRRDNAVLTCPIKGTGRRSGDADQARKEREWLSESAKNRAENVMIVDLMRNDLSRVCRAGTVIVPSLVRAQAHPGVWHLVSDVTGELTPGCTDGRLVRSTFPPGSITGAPKVRAMEVIHELEATPREVYTGAIGYRSPSAGLELNVAIRTFEFHGDLVWLGAGGGIVADSEPSDEYQECLLKAGPLIAATRGRFASLDGPRPHPEAGLAALRPRPASGIFTSLRVTAGAAFELAAHLARLEDSAMAVFGKQLPSGASEQVDACLATGGSGRLRITIQPVGGPVQCLVELVPADPDRDNAPIKLHPVVIDGGLGPHKWTDRRLLTHLTRTCDVGPKGQLLIEDADGSVLETDRANIFAVFNGTLYTPPADGRILPGVARAKVINVAGANGIDVSICPFTAQELLSASEVFVTNSVRGLVPVNSIDAPPTAWTTGAITRTLAAALATALAGDDTPLTASEPARRQVTAPPARGRTRRRAIPPILLIDNYDSFTYNLAHLLRTAGSDVEVVSNDEVTAAEIAGFPAAGVMISPGPCAPSEAGSCVEAIRLLNGSIPVLGVCLGHQAIAAAYGARIVRTPPVHGKTSVIKHDGLGIFRGLPATFDATRYHSLAVDEASLPDVLSVCARTPSGLVMAIRHASHPVAGVQFHPESILTSHGAMLIRNFVMATTRRDGADRPFL